MLSTICTNLRALTRQDLTAFVITDTEKVIQNLSSCVCGCVRHGIWCYRFYTVFRTIPIRFVVHVLFSIGILSVEQWARIVCP